MDRVGSIHLSRNRRDRNRRTHQSMCLQSFGGIDSGVVLKCQQTDRKRGH